MQGLSLVCVSNSSPLALSTLLGDGADECPWRSRGGTQACPRKGGGVKGWFAHLPVPDVGGQYLVLLILGKERELGIGVPMG